MTITRNSATWRKLQRQFITSATQRNEPCALCGLPINYQAHNRNADNAPSVDHIRSWRDHPNLRTDPANLQIVHQSCNRSKGTTTGPLSLGNMSRQWGPHETHATTGKGASTSPTPQ